MKNETTRYLTVQQAAARLGLSHTTIYKKLWAKVIKSEMYGRYHRIPEAEVERYARTLPPSAVG